jgi:hypothetical protein
LIHTGAPGKQEGRDPKLTKKGKYNKVDAENDVHVSVPSLWQITKTC